LKIKKSLEKINIQSLQKSNMKSQYRNIFLAGFLHCTLDTRWLGGSFLIVYKNNTGRLGSGFISVCLETCWLGQKSGLNVPDQYCENSREKWRKWISLTGSPCWPSASANHRQTG